MKPYDHQIAGALEALPILAQYGIVYFNWEERTGKTLTSIILQEEVEANNVLIITTKKALKDWKSTLKSYEPKFKHDITNYHQIKNLPAKNYDTLIIDEPHSQLTGTPKPGKMQQELQAIGIRVPYITYLSATPCAQGYHKLYPQLAISKLSPFSEYSNYYKFWSKYGTPNTIWLYGKEVEQYNKVVDQVWDDCKHLFITKTRKQLGFKQEPKDKLHYIELNPETRLAYNALLKDKIIELRGKDVICDHVSKLRTILHQLEGGTIKQHEITVNKKGKAVTVPVFTVLKNQEKIDYILEMWGDIESVVIMYNYIAEFDKLNAVFKNATLLQATSYAEGVDLSQYNSLIIYSQNFSTSKHTQRRARQANFNRQDDITVHFLLVKKAISDQVYNTVSVNKKNYVDSTFMEEEI